MEPNKEIIIIDDFSDDGTRELLKELEQSEGLISLDQNGRELILDNIKIVFQDRNQGKGAAIRRGFDLIEGDVIIIQDADLEYGAQDYLRLIDPIKGGFADVVYGSRYKGGAPHRILFFRDSIFIK